MRSAPRPDLLDLIAEWRAAGLTVHLATKQDRGRAAYMKIAIGHADLMDGVHYSSDLAFVDDPAAKVAGAREVGLRAVRWKIAVGTEALLVRLASVGLR